MQFADDFYVYLMTSEVRDFLAALREDATTLRRHFDERGAALTEKFAAELETFLRSKADDAVSVADAARASGLSEDHLRRQLSAGVLSNVGVPGKPRIRRSELRPKRKKSLARNDADSYDVAADVRSLRVRRGE